MNRVKWIAAVLIAAGVAVQPPGPAQARQEKKWDVAADLGPVTKLAFDTSEGTWMNVDVSPDGKRVVFDLLGDIYSMSIDGSGAAPATRLTSGTYARGSTRPPGKKSNPVCSSRRAGTR